MKGHRIIDQFHQEDATTFEVEQKDAGIRMSNTDINSLALLKKMRMNPMLDSGDVIT